MKKPVTRRRADPYQRQVGCVGWLLRLSVIFVTVAALGTAAFLFLTRWQAGQYSSSVSFEGGSSALNPVERFILQTYLSRHAAELTQPVGAGDRPIPFEVLPGQSAELIATNLATASLLGDTELFLNYVRYFGLDSQLEAGQFLLFGDMSTVEIAMALTEASRPEVIVQFIEGWRLEEMSDHLRQLPSSPFDAGQFQAIASRQQPIDLSPYPFLSSLPAEASLEGFLFPDTYRLDATATSADLITAMLDNFANRVTPAIRQQIGQQGLDLQEAVVLASIVEREAVVAEERPLIANVFLNRLALGMKLDADPTVQYALGQQEDGSWWKRGLTLSDLGIDSAYNTYLYAGLPPSPIANPGLASLQAVAAPADTAYLYFVADCDLSAPGTHLFGLTYDNHLVNVAKCR